MILFFLTRVYGQWLQFILLGWDWRKSSYWFRQFRVTGPRFLHTTVLTNKKYRWGSCRQLLQITKSRGRLRQNKLVLEHSYLTIKTRKLLICSWQWLLWCTLDHGRVPGLPIGPWRSLFVDKSPAFIWLLPPCLHTMCCLWWGGFPTGDIRFVQETGGNHW